MLIALKEIARLDGQIVHGDRLAEVDDVDIRMRHEDIRREEVKANLPDFVQVPHAAVRDDAHAAERRVDIGIHLAA